MAVGTHSEGKMNISELVGRARWVGFAARERITVAAEGLAPAFRVFLIILAAFVIGYGVAWWTAEKRVNAEWRQRIAAASSAVREANATGTAEIKLTDDEIIQRLGDTDEQLRNAERALEAARKDRRETVGCPALAAQCYRVRQ